MSTSEIILPPSLLLPNSTESIENYRQENFNSAQCDYDTVVQYGAFLVGLIAYSAAESGRVNLMPKTSDIEEMHAAGYGFGVRQLLRQYGGLQKLQQALGFFPDGYTPSSEELEDRIQWLVKTTQTADILDNPTFADVVKWGSDRRLISPLNKIYRIEGNTLALRRLVDMEKKLTKESLSCQDVYRFGATVLKEHGRPLTSEELNSEYRDQFISDPYQIIKVRFKSLGAFWSEFDYLPDTRSMDKQTVLDRGVQWQIKHGVTLFTARRIEDLSKDKLFASKIPIYRHFESLPLYQEAVAEGYDTFLKLQDYFQENGVSAVVFKHICHNFSTNLDYQLRLLENIETLVKLSSSRAEYILSLIQRGLDLERQDVFEMQFIDMIKILKSVGIRSTEECRFIFDAIPRFDSEEALDSDLFTLLFPAEDPKGNNIDNNEPDSHEAELAAELRQMLTLSSN